MTHWAFSNHHMLGLPTDVQHLGRSTETTGRTDRLPWKLKITSTWHKYIDSWVLWLKQCYIDWNQLIGDQTGQIGREECRFTRMFAHPEFIWFTSDSPANVTPSTENLCPQKVHEIPDISKHLGVFGKHAEICVWEVDSTFNQILIRRDSAAGLNHWKWKHCNETLKWNNEINKRWRGERSQ